MVGLAVKVTDVPAQTVWLGETLKLTDGVKIAETTVADKVLALLVPIQLLAVT